MTDTPRGVPLPRSLVRWPGATTRRARVMCRLPPGPEGVAPVTSVLAAVEVLLARYSAATDIVLRVSLTDAPARALRFRYDPERGVLDSFASLAERLDAGEPPEPRGTDTPTVGFALAGGPVPEADLVLVFDEREHTVTADHRADLFIDAEGAERLVSSLGTLLEAMAKAPDAVVGDLPILSDDELRTALGHARGAPRAERPFVPVHEQIARHAARAPEAIALVAGGTTVTYRELDERANRLARRLLESGTGRGDLVALFTTRSPEMVVGMLAALKAGAAYLPIDPDYPRARVEFVLADASPSVVLTQTALRDRLPATETVRVELDTAEAQISRLPATPPPSPSGTDPGDRVYVIYTSGSTGRPKGVEIPAAGLDNLVQWHRDTYRLAPGDRTPQLASVAFDASVWEIWPTLASGAALHLADEAATADPTVLIRWLTEERITVAFLPTPLAEVALEEAWPRDCALRVLLTGGDTLHRRPPPGLPFTLVNHYGPTENSVVSTAIAVPAATADDERPEPPIGRPIAGTYAHVLDERLRPVPVGVPGELHVGGAGLALGYLNRPELTRERFVPDPFGPGRLYRTGDLAARRPDGTLSFLGRIDDQVKLRGLRIEPGEIEATMGEHPGVAEAAVALREDSPGQRRLVGYVVPSGGGGLDDLRGRLADRLPGYMVPAAFVVLPALPLTPHGKVDRRALPAPGIGLGEYVEPRPGIETELAGLWAETLGTARVGALDDFYSLGGDSLSATRLTARLRRRYAARLPASAILAAPTVRELARLVERAEHTDERPIAPAPRTGHLPLGIAQRQLWLLDRIDSTGIAYNVPFTIDLSGPLDPEVLRAALGTLVARHEALRTGFPVTGGEPGQAIGDPPGALPLPVLDEAELGDADAWITAESRRPFDLTTGPPLCATLLRRGPEDHRLLVVVHHVVFDGWSLGVFCRELGEIYDARVRGAEPDLPDLPVQPADVAVWERGQVTPESLEPGLEFWTKTLAGAPQTLDLPTDRTATANPTNAGARRVITLDAERAARLAAFARAQGTTTFTALFAAFNVLLSRYTGAEDIVVGCPVAGRTRPELEGLIGCFINPLPLRTDLSGAPTFRELLGRVRAAQQAAHEHQDVPFSEIVTALRPDRPAGRAPVYQVLFAFEDAHDAEFAFAGVRARVTEVDFGSTRDGDLGISITSVGGGLRVCAEYRTELFAEKSVDRLLAGFATLLSGALAEPDRPVGELAVLGDEERRRLVHDWNRTASPFPDDVAIHELVERQVDATPDAAALVFEDEAELTYRELDDRANRLAHHLRALGIGPEDRVGVCLRRSPEMVVAVLAVLKAGGGYVPLDPANPPGRLAFITEDAGLRLVLTQRELRPALAAAAVPLIELDGDAGGGEIAGRPATRPASVNAPHDLAYVIYTSGSTGRPKGVMIEHRSVCNFVTTVHGLFAMGPHDNVLQFASLGFDVSVFEIFSALTCGARLCLARQETLLSVTDLTAFMREKEITVMDMPPSVMALLPGDAFPALRIAFVGGEAFSGGLVNRWSVPGRRFFNGYGPTEGTVTVIVEECSGSGWDTSPPIGRPMPNMRAHVLDAEGRLVPVGVPGELYIGGAGLARGYLGRPELTAERFVRDPFHDDPAERLYRTGDLVRRLPDGRLDFLGRIDDQVKLRGFRVELGEVESVLRGHPGVIEAAVALWSDSAGQRRLAGYLVPADPAAAPEPAALRAHLAERLPEYMVPAAFVALAEFPLNASGKIDRRALPEPAAAHLAVTGELVEPRNRRERTLAGIWCRLLGLDRVGVHDGFFALGGHSLLGVRLGWEIQREFGVDVPVRAVFENPTIAGLAVVVEDAMLALLTKESR
ncbi:amino acid adenylation domain-containing protein [Actinomadura fulvescens]|uniref:Carrier domain-containing protein n=1 Tax=Actinomadura fulvescens TaxID=46160 RepID=A0ABN3PF68_9ACTN